MDDLLTRLTTALADRYKVEREIGAGGMATVFLAEDLKHRRQVAIKVLKPDLAAVMGAERFLREIEITAQLNHPHVLPLLDSGDAEGFLFYAMPFVEGESLRDRIEREKQLPVDEAIRIAREVAAALSYAHSMGLVHRDIKPENVLLSHGEAVVADFGISRAVSAAGGEKLTQTGMAVGTPGYMSPEQASGDEVDGRSDLYSLACVLYEMLAGETPFTGPSAQAIMAKHAIDPRPSVRTVRDTVPESVDAAIKRAMAKAPADRFGRAAEFTESMSADGRAVPPSRLRRRILLGAGAIVVLGAAAWLGLTRLSTLRSGAAVVFGPSSQVTFSGTVRSRPALSPDGGALAYAERDGEGGYNLVVLDLATQQSLTIAQDDAGFFNPVWQPSGDSVLVLAHSRGAVYAVSRFGGTPRRITDAPWAESTPDGDTLRSWVDFGSSPDGERLVALDRVLIRSKGDTIFSRLIVFPSSGGRGTPTDTIPLLRKGGAVAWSPAGEHVAVDIWGDEKSLIVLMTASGAITDSLVLGGEELPRFLPDLQWSADGRVLYGLYSSEEGSEIHRVAVHPAGHFAGDPALVLRFEDDLPGFTVSGDGHRIYYRLDGVVTRPWVVDVGEDASVSNRRRLLTGTAEYGEFSVSADGSRFAFRQSRPGGIYIGGTGGGPTELVVRDGHYPSISPDGRRIAFSDDEGKPNVVDISSGEQRRVSDRSFRFAGPAWSPDGRRIAFSTRGGITVVDLETGQELLFGQGGQVRLTYSVPRFSPDGQRLAVIGWREDQYGIWMLELSDSTFRFLTPGAPRTSSVGQQMWGWMDFDLVLLHWSATDTVYFRGKVGSDIWAVPAVGGQPRLFVAIPFECSAETLVPEQHKVICSEFHDTHDVWRVEALAPSR